MGKKITTTRGDTFMCEFPLLIDGEEYELQEGDKVRFAAKEAWDDAEPCICKDLDGYVLTLDPEDTKGLDFGTYYYDVQITFADGTVTTYISKAKLVLDMEAD